MAATSSTDPEVGHRAPAFKLPRDGGAKASLADYKGRYLVLYFYPKANTTGCTKEAIDFSRLKPRFAKLGADVLGVSADPVPALDKFRDKHDLTVALASDEDKAMLKDYGAWGKKSMYGRSFMGVIRKTVLIGPDGKVIKVWPKVKVPGHAEEVLAEVQAAAKGVTAK
jgi:peroxiredoxin Q/BCP